MTRSRAVALVPAVLLLAGCGADLHPGAAATVGSQTLSQSSVDRVTRDLCTVLRSQSGESPQRYANSLLQVSVVQTWLQRSMAEQVGREYRVKAGASYEQAVEQTRQQLAGVDESVRDSVVSVFTASAYFSDVLTQIGRRVLVDGGTPSPTDGDALTQGIDTVQIWEDTHPIETSPRLPDLTLGDDRFVPTPDQSSVAVSSFARQASAEQPSEDYLASLPAGQVCG